MQKYPTNVKVVLRFACSNQKDYNNAEKLANKTQREVRKNTKKLRERRTRRQTDREGKTQQHEERSINR